MSLLGIHALPVVNAELFCKRRVYSLPRESNGGVYGRWLPTHITHSISCSHLQLESLSCRVMILQRCSVIEHWLCASAQLSCMSAMHVATQCTCPVVVNAVMRLLKSTARSRAVRIWMIKIGFDPAADSIRIRSIKIGFNPNSVLESVRTLVWAIAMISVVVCHFSHVTACTSGIVT